MSTPSLSQLHRAVKISEQIETLQAELQSILGTSGGAIGNAKRKYTKKAASAEASTSTESPASAKKTRKKRKKGKMSAEGRAAIVAAQKARWAKVKKEKAKK